MSAAGRVRRPDGSQGRGAGDGEARRRWSDAGDPRRRAVSLLAVLLVLLTLVSAQLLRVQVFGAARYVEYGEEQRLRGIDLPAGRGFIFDRNMETLAINVPHRTIVADPRAVTRPPRTARALARLLDTDAAEIYDRLTQDRAFVYLARQVDDEVADEIEEQDLAGIWTIEEPQRVNPADGLALSVLGQVDTDNVGVSGLELGYDEQLTGSDGSMVLERDLQGRTIPAGRQDVVPPVRGEDLVLTLDQQLQFRAEEIIARHVEETGAEGGTAVVTDPRTGEVYALVNVDRDPETGEVRNSPVNRAVVETYEPGSVMKVVTLAAALDAGVVTPETEMTVPDRIAVSDGVFTDDSGHPPMVYSVRDVLAESSNVGTIMIAQQLGSEGIYDYLVDFGLDAPTGLDFPGEATGLFPEPAQWSGTSIATIPLGQGISVTPMQMLAAFNVIANDGVYVPPTLVGGVVDAEGDRQPTARGPSERVVSSATAAQMRDMMVSVVTEGTGTGAAIDGYAVAGKTGTARQPNPEGNGYTWPDGYHHAATFAGFMPAQDPTLSVLVALDRPDATYAGSTAAPAFADLSRHALDRLKLPPTTG